MRELTMLCRPLCLTRPGDMRPVVREGRPGQVIAGGVDLTREHLGKRKPDLRTTRKPTKHFGRDCATGGSPLLPQGRMVLWLPTISAFLRYLRASNQSVIGFPFTPRTLRIYLEVTQLWRNSQLKIEAPTSLGMRISNGELTPEGFVSARALRGGLCFFSH